MNGSVEITLLASITQSLRTIFSDTVYLLTYLIVFVFAVPFPQRRQRLLHAFQRNFWGQNLPKKDGRPIIWMHAVSVGEVLGCCPLLERLREQRPDIQFVLSVGTPDGMAVAQQKNSEGDLFFAPFDFSWAVRNVFESLQPKALLIAENDFWPNMLNEATARNIPLAIFNTRMSPREQTEHTWNGWLLRPGLSRTLWWGAVTEGDAEWIRYFFRVNPSQIEVTGCSKFDGIVRDPLKHPRTLELRERLGFDPNEQILVAGSTHPDEEEVVISIATRLSVVFPQLRLVIAPRDVARCNAIQLRLRQREIPFAIFSQLPVHADQSSFVTLVDSIGILRYIWGVADIAFVGGSLVRHGGQNVIEPASYGRPICFGPHIWNFQSVASEFLKVGAAAQVRNEAELERTLERWLANPEEAKQIGIKAQEIVRSRTRPLARTVDGILSMLPVEMPSTSDSAKAQHPIEGPIKIGEAS